MTRHADDSTKFQGSKPTQIGPENQQTIFKCSEPNINSNPPNHKKLNMKIFSPKSIILVTTLSAGSVTYAEEIKSLKDAAIIGSLASYAYAYVIRNNFTECQDTKRVGLDAAADDELNSTTVSYTFAECKLQTEIRPLGFNFKISPTFLASGWKANSGSGSTSISEVAFVPRVQYIFPYDSFRLDATAGVGVALISNPYVGERVKSTNFQFSDEISFGISDATDHLRIALNYRHISNLSIALPNNGVDFRGISITYRIP
jgi:hypothetical protein